MNRKALLKFGFFLVGVAVTVPLALLGVSLVAQFVAEFQKGADPASIFHGHSLEIPAEDQALWLDVESAIGSVPSIGEQEELIATYWLAWEALRRADLTGDTSDITTYWAGSAYDQVMEAMVSDQASIQSHSGHALRLNYLSEDGSLAALDDEGFLLHYAVDEAMVSLTTTASVIMTIDNGFWRVRSISLHYQ